MKRITTIAIAALFALSGLVAGSSTASAAPPGASRLGSTQVVLKPSVFKLLGDSGIAPSTIGQAVAAPTKGTLGVTFPIRGFKSDNLRITHKGGIRLAASGKGIKISKLAVDLGRGKVSGRVSGNQVGKVGRVDLFTIVRAKKDTYGPAKLKLTGTAADALNATFGVEAFSAGDPFGYATPTITKAGLRNRAGAKIAAALEDFVEGR